jgi:hypothetical protein
VFGVGPYLVSGAVFGVSAYLRRHSGRSWCQCLFTSAFGPNSYLVSGPYLVSVLISVSIRAEPAFSVGGLSGLDNHLHALIRLDPATAMTWSDQEFVRR